MESVLFYKYCTCIKMCEPPKTCETHKCAKPLYLYKNVQNPQTHSRNPQAKNAMQT